ncbi:hypothetical protein EFK50_06875 [Nocardioides marmoriginsengisoli]|uniref:DUF2142 domain-containing protein n=1 Tax=Nocardioides marmoriginsengisoli TaxID=661483 RepID=A0A3N0CLC5_9ACTN|nr:DUF2142 domain-containing protein [Nocardioides marmoriginsengisoli]RNL64248.1 hypothetical protein EFK50_06875 [Nocardioides marmoriginsengisoli]
MNAADHRLRSTLLAGAGLLLVQLGWILSLAPHYGIDEFDHALRASSVAAGHWQPGDDLVSGEDGRGDLIPVRADVARSVRASCESRPYTGPLNCRPKADLGNGEVLIASAAARYNPTYYAVVGTVAKSFHGDANLYALRIVSALLCCLLFMLTLWLALGGARTLWPLAGMLLAALPTTVYSSTVAAPNGLEMFAGLGVWVALGVVVAGPAGRQRRGSAYGVLALSAAVLTNTHTLGPVWLVLILAVTAVVHGPVRTVRSLWPRRGTEVVLAVAVSAAVAFAVGWIVLSGVNDPATEGTTYPGSPWPSILRGLVLWPLQTIGAYPLRDDEAPLLVYGLMVTLLGLLVVHAVRRLGLRSRTTRGIVLTAVIAFAVPAVLTARTFHQIGAAWQGRYAAPFVVGIILLACAALDRHRSRLPRGVVVGGVAVLLLCELVSQWSVMTAQDWDPPPTVLLLLLALGAAGCWAAATQVFRPAVVPLPVAPHEDLVAGR